MIMAALRGPAGCPWDQKQTPQTMHRHLLDEAYEVAEAIEGGDPDAVCEELGDLLFLIVFVVRLYQEQGRFDLGDVIAGAAEKMIRRHPHVFGTARVTGADQVLERWERIKANETGRRDKGRLDGVPRGMPALGRAQRLSSRAAKVGFDWPGPAQVLDKVDEELAEARAAGSGGDPDRVADELGDLLFTLVNLLRHLGQNAEDVLHRASDKFQRRFSSMERGFEAQGLSLDQVSPQEMNLIWDDLKRTE
jgi:tetrapyrrole methylase family protein/MazG family protein/ATP diphosphatase